MMRWVHDLMRPWPAHPGVCQPTMVLHACIQMLKACAYAPVCIQQMCIDCCRSLHVCYYMDTYKCVCTENIVIRDASFNFLHLEGDTFENHYSAVLQSWVQYTYLATDCYVEFNPSWNLTSKLTKVSHSQHLFALTTYFCRYIVVFTAGQPYLWCETTKCRETWRLKYILIYCLHGAGMSFSCTLIWNA